MAYGKKYEATVKTYSGTYTYLLEIYKNDYADASSEITVHDSLPLILKQNGDDELNDVIYTHELIFAFYATQAQVATYDEFLTSTWKTFYATLKRNGTVIYYGWLQNANASRQFLGSKYIYELSFVDGLSFLKNQNFEDTANYGPYTDRANLLTQLKRALSFIGFNLDFRVQLNTYEETLIASTDCVLEKATIDSHTFYSDTDGSIKYESCWDVITKILKPLNCVFMQINGYYYIINLFEQNSYLYSFDWATLAEGARDASDLVTNIDAVKFIGRGRLMQIPPAKNFIVTNKNKNKQENYVLNGDFSNSTTNWTNGSATEAWFNFTTNNGALRTTSTDDNDKSFISDAFAVTVGTDNRLRITWRAKVITKNPAGASYPTIKATLAGPSFSASSTEVTSSADWQYFSWDFALTDGNTGNYTVQLWAIPQGATPLTTLVIDWDDVYAELFSDTPQVFDYKTDSYLTLYDTARTDIIEQDIYLTDSPTTQYANGLKVTTTLTTSWRSYGNTEDVSFTELYCMLFLTNRQSYKNKIDCIIIDSNDAFYGNGFLQFDSKEYFISRYSKNLKDNNKVILDCTLVEMLSSVPTVYANTYRLTVSEGTTGNSVVAGTGLSGGGTFTTGSTALTMSLDTSSSRNVDHSAVSISAGTGLTGGGTIAANRTISLSHLGIQSLSDPGADRIMFWDDSAGAVTWLTLGSTLSITDTTISIVLSSLADGAEVGNSNSHIEFGNGTLGELASDISIFAGTSPSNGRIFFYAGTGYRGLFDDGSFYLVTNTYFGMGTSKQSLMKFDGTNTIWNLAAGNLQIQDAATTHLKYADRNLALYSANPADTTFHFYDGLVGAETTSDAFYFEHDTSGNLFNLWCKTSNTSNVQFLRVYNGATPYMGIGGAGDAAKVAKFTGDVQITGTLAMGTAPWPTTFAALTDVSLSPNPLTVAQDGHIFYYIHGTGIRNIAVDTLLSGYTKNVNDEVISGTWTFTERAQFSGNTAPTTDAGVELGDSGTSGFVLSYDRDGAAYYPLIFNALSHDFNYSGTNKVNSDATSWLMVDNYRLDFGDGNDFRMAWNATNMLMDMYGNGNLLIRANTTTEFTFDLYDTYVGTLTCGNVAGDSDKRLKKNIKEFNPPRDEVEKLKKLLRVFNWKKSGREDIGMVAQEVERECPLLSKYLVKTDSKGYKSIFYDKLVLMLAI